MNTIKKILMALLFVLSLNAIFITPLAAATSGRVMQAIDNTVIHIETAQKAVDANDSEAAQEHIKAARQAAKNIIGGSLEVSVQRGSSALSKARRSLNKNDLSGASKALKNALDIFKSLAGTLNRSGRGGLK
ncbi:MAG: hypothetical protein CVV13_10700 [Gammaproteobacteria bacterium HGW-Gammaproteobacteria-3]|jgi:flagellin-specific chaperone FliS|nr:MAG: hypothetical protein CVV13_10700 [Gammaproteobacteria bacterium HGW-Gammaproteobacteria-3]